MSWKNYSVMAVEIGLIAKMLLIGDLWGYAEIFALLKLGYNTETINWQHSNACEKWASDRAAEHADKLQSLRIARADK